MIIIHFVHKWTSTEHVEAKEKLQEFSHKNFLSTECLVCMHKAKISFDGNIEILRREMYMYSAWILVRDWLQNEYTENYQPEPKHRKRMLLTVVMDITARTCSSIILWVLDSWMKWIALKIHCARRIVCCFDAFVFQCLLLKKICMI